MKEKGMSKGELTSVAYANGGIENMVNVNAKGKDAVALFQHIADEDKLEKLAIDNHRRSRLQSFLTRVSEWSVELGQTWPWKGLLGMVQDIQSLLIVLSSHKLNKQTPIATE